MLLAVILFLFVVAAMIVAFLALIWVGMAGKERHLGGNKRKK